MYQLVTLFALCAVYLGIGVWIGWECWGKKRADKAQGGEHV